MFINWFLKNYIEILGALSGLIYLFFSIRQLVWLWPLGIISSLFYTYIFFTAKFYADMGLQVYYFFISFYGWYNWIYGKTGDSGLPVKKASYVLLIILIILTFIITFIIAGVLTNYTDSPLPFWDALTTAGGIVATWMLARKIIEHWLFWIIIDAISMGLYIYKGLYPTSILFFVYFTMAAIGYINWKKDLKTESVAPSG